MTTTEIIQVQVPTDVYLASQASLMKALANPERLTAQIAEASRPENLAALCERLATYRHNRLTAEAKYFANA